MKYELGVIQEFRSSGVLCKQSGKSRAPTLGFCALIPFSSLFTLSKPPFPASLSPPSAGGGQGEAFFFRGLVGGFYCKVTTSSKGVAWLSVFIGFYR